MSDDHEGYDRWKDEQYASLRAELKRLMASTLPPKHTWRDRADWIYSFLLTDKPQVSRAVVEAAVRRIYEVPEEEP